MWRREFIGIGTVGVLAMPTSVKAQPTKRMRSVGFLGMSPASASPYFDQFRDALRDLGWTEARNVVIEYRSADGNAERFAALASDLVQSKVAVFVAQVPAAVFAAKNATQSIPIVMVNTPDPVELRLVASLARPGGNITGLTSLSTEMSSKQLDLLKQLIPTVSRIAVVSNPTNPWHPNALRLIETNAPCLVYGVQFSASDDPKILNALAPPRQTARHRSQASATRDVPSARVCGGGRSRVILAEHRGDAPASCLVCPQDSEWAEARRPADTETPQARICH